MKLCKDCEIAKKEKRRPRHLVHPETGSVDVFDVRGEAICTSCWAVWQRHGNHAKVARVLSPAERSALLRRLASYPR